MKKYISLVLLLLICLPCIVFAQDKSNAGIKVKKIVTVGYSLKDREKLFGNKSLEEIDQILDLKCRELLEKDIRINQESQKTKEGLIITIAYPQENIVEP